MTADTLFHRLRESDIGGRLVEDCGIEAIIADVALSRWRHRDFLVIACAGLFQNRLKVVFLQRHKKEDANKSV
jgi:hypothetical protein